MDSDFKNIQFNKTPPLAPGIKRINILILVNLSESALTCRGLYKKVFIATKYSMRIEYTPVINTPTSINPHGVNLKFISTIDSIIASLE